MGSVIPFPRGKTEFTDKPCHKCGGPILSGQMYIKTDEGPEHCSCPTNAVLTQARVTFYGSTHWWGGPPTDY